MSINFLYGTFFLILYCTPICLVESSCLTKSPSSSSDLSSLSISLFSFCLAFPLTSIILVRGPLVYPSISGNIRQPKMEPSLRQYTQNRVCYVVYRVIRSSRNNPSPFSVGGLSLNWTLFISLRTWVASFFSNDLFRFIYTSSSFVFLNDSASSLWQF